MTFRDKLSTFQLLIFLHQSIPLSHLNPVKVNPVGFIAKINDVVTLRGVKGLGIYFLPHHIINFNFSLR